MALAWSNQGIRKVILPGYTTGELHHKLKPYYTFLATPPDPIYQVVSKLRNHLLGHPPQSYEDIPLDINSTDFAMSVYRAVQQLKPGETATYGQIARNIGKPGAARAVGQALARNPVPLLIPCHRVISTSQAGGFTAPGGLNTKETLLYWERRTLTGNKIPDNIWTPSTRTEGTKHLARTGMSSLINKSGQITLRPLFPARPFAALAKTVLYQQLAGKAADAIFARFLSIWGGVFPDPDQLIGTNPQLLYQAGISRNKVTTLHHLATAILEKKLDLANLSLLPDAQIISHLTALHGIGVWTAQMFMIFHLGRPDVWPSQDLGIHKAMQTFLPLKTNTKPLSRTAINRYVTSWRPYRTLAAIYLWRSMGGLTIGDCC